MLRKDIVKAYPTAGTVDPEEIARFNALAEEWWKPDGAFKVVHAFNQARVAHLTERVPALMGRSANAGSPLAGLKMIDVGCGAGLVTEPMARLGADTLGIDASERNIAVAQRHAHLSGAPVRYVHVPPEQLVGQPERFDIVLSLEVVEHVADLAEFLRLVSGLVAPGGLLVIGTLNRTWRSYVKAIIGAEHILRWLPRGTHDWKRFVTPRELEQHLGPLGLEVIERAGVELRLPSMRWRIGDDCSATYLQFHRRLA